MDTIFAAINLDVTSAELCMSASGRSEPNLILLFGIIVLLGTFGARIFQRFHVPQVVGYIVVGILLGDVFGVIGTELVEKLEPFNLFALGIIGFMIGGELRGEIFKKYGRQFFIILFSQGIGAFVLAGIGASVVAWFITHNLPTSIAMGLVLGAIASATAPAATVNVLWEYKTRGPLTAAVLAIVALDDALALLLYKVAVTTAHVLIGTRHDSILASISILLGEIFGAVMLGFLVALALFFILKFIRDDDKILAFALASLMIVVGVAMTFEIGPILPAMTLGITIANLAPRQSKNIFELIKKFSPPIYISFFVLAGAHMEFSKISTLMLIMILVYVTLRAVGKIAGAWWGGKYSGAPKAVQKYLGICLLPQAGVAIGLAILAGHQFNAEFGKIIIMVVMTGTFIMEIVGPMLVKVGVKKAGEVGMNVTEEDLIKIYAVEDVMDASPTSISHDLPLQQILDTFSKSESVYYPVIDKESNVIGIITIAGIKEMFANQDVAGWLLAMDVAEPVLDKTILNKPLGDVIEHMQRYNLENMLVVEKQDSDKLVGVLDYRKALRKISAEVLRRREMADTMALTVG
ncbi:MAG: CBS domain-containing protein [Planctomycetes bacterium]|nr:CBS domain-containing protein [Planctomycetota bacterium]